MPQPDMPQPFAPALVIAGMHRSGTSLAAALVTSAGIHLGDRIMGPERGNIKGHFEDLDFYELHQRALAANGLAANGFTCQTSINVPPAFEDAFAELVTLRRGLGRPWGWKDPRTTLFLEAWQHKIAEARFLLVFRRPWEVIDSLFRRGDTDFRMNPRLAADVWLAYNRRIHDFFLTHRDHCLLVETTFVAHHPAALIADVGRLLGIELRIPAEHYEPGLLLEDTSLDRVGLVRQMLPAAIDLYDSLHALAADHAGPTSYCTPAAGADPFSRDELLDAAVMQWVRAAQAEDSDRSRMAQLQSASQHAADELEQLAASYATARHQLEASAQQVAALREQLAVTQRRKTFRDRLSIEGRRLVQLAYDSVGLRWQPRRSFRPQDRLTDT